MKPSPIDKFISDNPEFREDAEVLQNISKKVIFKALPPLDSYLPVTKLQVLKKLFENDFYKSNTLRKTYEEISKNESNNIERMIFDLLAGKKILFDDIKLKYLFYREFPTHIDQFQDANTGIVFKVQDMIFKKVYFHTNLDTQIQDAISRSNTAERTLFLLCLKDHLASEFIKNMTSRSIPQDKQLWALSLFALPKKDYYAIITCQLLFSPFSEKIQLFRFVGDFIDHEILGKCLLSECLDSEISTTKMYIVFLKLVEILTLDYGFKLKLLYSWLRFFILHNRFDLFTDLLDKLKHAKIKDKELEFYIAVEDMIRGRCEWRTLQEYSEDTNHISKISLVDVITKLKTDCVVDK